MRIFKLKRTCTVGEVTRTLEVEYPVDANKQLNIRDVQVLYEQMSHAVNYTEVDHCGYNFNEESV